MDTRGVVVVEEEVWDYVFMLFGNKPLKLEYSSQVTQSVLHMAMHCFGLRSCCEAWQTFKVLMFTA